MVSLTTRRRDWSARLAGDIMPASRMAVRTQEGTRWTLEALALTSAAVVQPLFTAIVLAAVGHALRLLAIYAASHSGNE